MAPRPYDADEPPGGEPRDEEQGTSPGDEGTQPARDDEVQRAWDDIVARLTEPEDPRAWAPDPVVAEQEEHFVPPDPGPVLGGDPLLTMAWTAVVGVPAFLLLTYLLMGGLGGVLARAAGVVWLAGLAVLVWRMPRDRSTDDGPGAVV